MSGHGIDCRLEQIADDSPIESDEWLTGRAGMQYRDLIPDRLGGRVIASHIRILNGGPVPDYVHHHHVEFQIIYCYNGWVTVVYEDQGPPFVMQAGDCVLQPPHIRHRVLECSDNMEVIEVSSPAEHETLVDHEMELPASSINEDRAFNGQCFVRHELDKATWNSCPEGFESRDTGIGEATAGRASVQVIRATNPMNSAVFGNDSDSIFSFVLRGSALLQRQGEEDRLLSAEESFVTPRGEQINLAANSNSFELLQVSFNLTRRNGVGP
jgi:quercetin dioxygenase-like cupin family protein